MSDIAIKVEGLGKKYTILHEQGGGYNTLRDTIASTVRAVAGRIRHPLTPYNRESAEEFWALKDVNFEVKQGDRIGIIGRNGAGKSTLLKVLSRITEPSTGKVSINGRVASLLEVGTGFHPELSGRENIYLNGAILGMKRSEIRRKFDEIVEFAEVEKFLDTPVKRYSSGMYVRLAFAVAAHLEPEILIVDEVLAVGDAPFQKKCLGKMEDVSKNEGRTVLFVSHNMGAVASICNKGVLLQGGTVVYNGLSLDVVTRYSEMMIGKKVDDREVAKATAPVYLYSASIESASDQGNLSLPIGISFSIVMVVVVRERVDGILVPNLHFKTPDGTYAFVTNAAGMKPLGVGKYRMICKIPGHFLNDGLYSVGVAVTEYSAKGYTVQFFERDYLTFTIVDDIFKNPLRYGYTGPMPGVVRPFLDWSVELMEEKP